MPVHGRALTPGSVVGWSGLSGFQAGSEIEQTDGPTTGCGGCHGESDDGGVGRDRRRATGGRHIVKRAIDVVGAATALVVLSPVLVVVAGLVRLRLGSPVLFRQTRPGLHGRPFELVKFRTMTDDRGPDGTLLDDADRLPAFGPWLRATSLDELPELVNVLRGDMSLVGPRPLLMEYLDLYSPHQGRRHEVRPGITGWSQVNGLNTREGISAEGHATAPRFRGND